MLAILAMLALKDALCVAPGGSAPLFPFRSAPWPPMFQAGTGKRRLNRTRKPARHDRSHALTTQKGTSWRCGNRGHFGVALTEADLYSFIARQTVALGDAKARKTAIMIKRGTKLALS